MRGLSNFVGDVCKLGCVEEGDLLGFFEVLACELSAALDPFGVVGTAF